MHFERSEQNNFGPFNLIPGNIKKPYLGFNNLWAAIVIKNKITKEKIPSHWIFTNLQLPI